MFVSSHTGPSMLLMHNHTHRHAAGYCFLPPRVSHRATLSSIALSEGSRTYLATTPQHSGELTHPLTGIVYKALWRSLIHVWSRTFIIFISFLLLTHTHTQSPYLEQSMSPHWAQFLIQVGAHPWFGPKRRQAKTLALLFSWLCTVEMSNFTHAKEKKN